MKPNLLIISQADFILQIRRHENMSLLYMSHELYEYILKDRGQLYQDKVRYYFPSGPGGRS